MFTATGILMFSNIYLRNVGNENIILLLYDNFKLSLYDLYQNLLITIRDFIDTFIDSNIKHDTSNIPINEPDIRRLNTDQSDNYKRWMEDFYKTNKDIDKATSLYESPYFYVTIIISTVIVSGFILYYNYDNILDYLKHIKPDNNINLNPSNENINININPSEQPLTSPQSSPVSDTSNLTVRGTNATSTSPIESNTSRVWADPSTSTTSNNTPLSAPKGGLTTNLKDQTIYSKYTLAPKNEGFICESLEEEYDYYFKEI